MKVVNLAKEKQNLPQLLLKKQRKKKHLCSHLVLIMKKKHMSLLI